MNNYNTEIGQAKWRNRNYTIHLKPEDRLRHVYMIGKTGTGKSTLFQNMMLQDIKNGAGGCFVDPHGEAIDWLLDRIPENRLEDVIVFDPSDTDWPIGLNLLEYKEESEKDFLVSEAIQIFYKLFDPAGQGVVGPQFEHWMRNAALTVMADPEGGTLIDIPRLFTDREFEISKRIHVKDKVVLAFWEDQMSKTSQFHRSEMLNYFTSKFGRFMTNSLMRSIIGQRESSLSFPDIISKKQILLVNLSKGKIGETNAYMLGFILMAKLQVAVMQRALLPIGERTPYYLYADEFQNVMTDAFIGMLSEARKYGLGIHLTNQYMNQLTDEIRDAVLGNAGTLISFQIGAQDVSALLPEFESKNNAKPHHRLKEEDFQYLPKHHYYIRLMLEGVTHPAFAGHSLPPMDVETSITPEHVKNLSRLRYATPASTL